MTFITYKAARDYAVSITADMRGIHKHKAVKANAWRNAATWTVNLWFGDHWAELAEDGFDFSPEYLRDMVEEYVYDLIGKDSTTAGFIWDMLDLNVVDWDTLRDHYAPAEAVA